MNDELMHWAEEQARLHQVLTNPRRVLILHALAKKELSVGEIAACINSSLQNTSQHLRIMRERGLLDSRRDGQTIYYWICDRTVLPVIGLMIS